MTDTPVAPSQGPGSPSPGRNAATPRTTPTGSAAPPLRVRYDEPRAARRVLWIGRVFVGLLSLALLLLLGRVGQLQQRPDPRVVKLLDAQSSKGELTARRGMLTDRRGRPLANTRIAYKLFVDPAVLDDPSVFAETVGYTLGYDPIEIAMALAKRPDSRYIVIDARVPDGKLDAARRIVGEIRGLSLDPYLVRDYPQGRLAGQVVGFVNVDGKGIEGLESIYNDQLAGTTGRYHFLRDARRRPLWLDADGYRTHADGGPVRLTIDINLQQIAERELADAIATFHAQAGQLIIMDPATGEILAMANYPGVDPDEAGNLDPALRRNRCVTDVFEPGSIFKPLVWAAATELGVADPNEKLDCSADGWWKPARGPVLRDASPHGTITWDEVLVFSSNIGMGIVAERLGKEKLYELIRDYGFGTPTGATLPGELPGLLRPVAAWSWTDLTRIPIGQGIACTPLQVTRAFGAIANDGLLVTPRITLDHAPGHDGSAGADASPRNAPQPSQATDHPTPLATPPSRVLSPATALHTRRVMRRTMTEGTGRKANSHLYDMFGKSGTAQLPDLVNGGYKPNGYVSSFIAGAPVERPRLIVGCFIHEPDKSIGHYGGTVAGPTVMRVMEQALGYLGVPSDVHQTAQAD